MVALVADSVDQLFDRDTGRGNIGVAEPEVDDVVARAATLDLQGVDGREDVRRQITDSSELHRGHGTRGFPGRR